MKPLFAFLLLLSFASPLLADGPTPYPDPKDTAAWPGQGPIRVFGWMTDNRNHFWKNREKDKGAVVFTGDSLIAGWKPDALAKAFPGMKIANRGVGGDTSRGLLFRFKEDVLALEPAAVVICIGGNDLSAHANPAHVESNMVELIKQTREYSSTVPMVIVLTTPRDNPKAPTKPGAQEDLNARLGKLADENNKIAVLDLKPVLGDADGKPVPENFAKDLLHIAGPGYEKWGAALKPVLESLNIK